MPLNTGTPIKPRLFGAMAMLLALASLQGCAIGRSEISLAGPAAPRNATAGRPLFIHSFVDEREFEQSPPDASTPSLGQGGVAAANMETRWRAVARKRGGFGKAMGDVLLAPGHTAADTLRDNFTAALSSAGYRVVSSAAGKPAPMVVDVHMKRFWSWASPQAFHQTLRTAIETDLVFPRSGKTVTVKAQVENGAFIPGDEDWMALITQALAEYRKQVAAAAPSFP